MSKQLCAHILTNAGIYPLHRMKKIVILLIQQYIGNKTKRLFIYLTQVVDVRVCLYLTCLPFISYLVLNFYLKWPKQS